MAPKKIKPNKRDVDSEEDEDEYRKKRDRNNLAVKRSRQKSKVKTMETLTRVNALKNENTILQEKVNTLTKELGFLKELFLAHAGTTDKSKFSDIDLQTLLADDADGESSK
ncbi:CCAAT/enhancer-binding protein gamma-like isoform X2 [Onthophagus taurus]|nr:CCAAT/enhancer-binding protein gamma-like isoform X2 [Onthophagus taurus]